MTVVLQQPLQGTKYLNVFVYPVTVAAGGTATVGSGADIAAGYWFEEFELERNSGLMEISATNAPIENYVPGKSSFSGTLTEIRKGDGTSNIETAIAATKYVKVLVNASNDGSTVGQTQAILGIVDAASVRSDVGKNTISITIRPVGVMPYTGTGTPGF